MPQTAAPATPGREHSGGAPLPQGLTPSHPSCTAKKGTPAAWHMLGYLRTHKLYSAIMAVVHENELDTARMLLSAQSLTAKITATELCPTVLPLPRSGPTYSCAAVLGPHCTRTCPLLELCLPFPGPLGAPPPRLPPVLPQLFQEHRLPQ